MARTRVAYSFVVDGAAKFEWQAALLIESLTRNARVAARNIKAHATPAVSVAFRNHARRLGVDLWEIEPFPGGRGYCNKIQQAFSPAFEGYERVVLCDCDLYFLDAPPATAMAAQAAGKVVDRPNPDVGALRDVYERAGLVAPRARPVDCPAHAADVTLPTNWNGGLYILDAARLRRWGRDWKAYALWLIGDAALAARCRIHIDQVSFALTLSRNNVDYELLTVEDNCPSHLGAAELAGKARGEIKALHYHDRIDERGLLLDSVCRHINVAIARANDDIARLIARRGGDEDFGALLNNWRARREKLSMAG